MRTRTSRSARSIVVALVVAVLTLLPVLAAPASAATRGSIHIHSRVCPLDTPPGANIYEACHDHPGPDGAEFTVDRRVPKPISPTTGNVSFGRVTAGDHLITLTSDWQPNEFLGMKAWCSNVTLGSGPNQATILYGPQAQFWVRVGSGSKLVCDVYFIPESGR